MEDMSVLQFIKHKTMMLVTEIAHFNYNEVIVHFVCNEFDYYI